MVFVADALGHLGRSIAEHPPLCESRVAPSILAACSPKCLFENVFLENSNRLRSFSRPDRTCVRLCAIRFPTPGRAAFAAIATFADWPRHAVNSRWLLIARGIHGHKPAAKKAEPWTAEAERSLRSLRTLPAIRSFTNTARALKKGGKAAREEKQQSGRKESDGASEDPYDFSNLEADIASALERLKNDLSKLRAGGRFNPEVLENLRVQVEKGSSKTVKLSDVAQIVPKGRTVQVIVGEKDVGHPTTIRMAGGNHNAAADRSHSMSSPCLRPYKAAHCH